MLRAITEFFQNIFYTLIAVTNSQALFSSLMPVNRFLPKITLPRYTHGAQIPAELAQEIIDQIPSLGSKAWTHYWRDIGKKFEEREDYRAACMSYIMGSFPKDNKEWKDEINELKRLSFLKWCETVNLNFREKVLTTPHGNIRHYWFRPEDYSSPVPVTVFVNGLEGSAEEIAFSLKDYQHEGAGYVVMSIPGSADYDRPMSIKSHETLRYVFDDLCRQPWVDPHQLGMVGFSMGAFWTLICTKSDPRIKFAICNGIPLKRTLSGGRGFGLNPIISEALLRIFGLFHILQMLPITRQMVKMAESLINQPSGPILAMNGENDTIVHPHDTVDLGNAPGNRLILIKNDDHCGLYHYDRMVSLIVRWSKRNLSLGQHQEKWRLRVGQGENRF
jgi:hypothetical protein